MTSGGAIPDQFDYDVLLSREACASARVNEDFAFESLPGDIFQLGNTSYRILQRRDRARVRARTRTASRRTSRSGSARRRGARWSCRRRVAAARGRLDWLDEGGCRRRRPARSATAATAPPRRAQLVEYLAAARAALGALPTQDTVIFERFFDETGDQHLVIHAPFGSRINKAWGLALRKRFCRRFNFELQAAALEDSIVISLGSVHSFPLHEPAGYLNSATAREVLIQAVIAAPLFEARWRWVATAALAILRQRAGRRTPPQWQRSDAAGPGRRGVPGPDRLRREPARRARACRTTRWCGRRSPTA